jgi:hypothetical protein
MFAKALAAGDRHPNATGSDYDNHFCVHKVLSYGPSVHLLRLPGDQDPFASDIS